MFWTTLNQFCNIISKLILFINDEINFIRNWEGESKQKKKHICLSKIVSRVFKNMLIQECLSTANTVYTDPQATIRNQKAWVLKNQIISNEFYQIWLYEISTL